MENEQTERKGVENEMEVTNKEQSPVQPKSESSESQDKPESQNFALEQSAIKKTEESDEKSKAERKPGKKLSRGKLIGLIILIAIIWFGAVQYFAAERYEAMVNVVEGENIMGINPTEDSLDFGDLSRDTGASRYINLKNEGKGDKKIIIWRRGAIADLIKLEESSFVLKAGEEKKVEFNIQVPPSAEFKKYEGSVMIFKLPAWF